MAFLWQGCERHLWEWCDCACTFVELLQIATSPFWRIAPLPGDCSEREARVYDDRFYNLASVRLGRNILLPKVVKKALKVIHPYNRLILVGYKGWCFFCFYLPLPVDELLVHVQVCVREQGLVLKSEQVVEEIPALIWTFSNWVGIPHEVGAEFPKDNSLLWIFLRIDYQEQSGCDQICIGAEAASTQSE